MSEIYFTCPACDEGFITQAELITHVALNHPESWPGFLTSLEMEIPDEEETIE